MDKIENFLKEPSMEKLERLRKSEIVKIGEKLDLMLKILWGNMNSWEK